MVMAGKKFSGGLIGGPQDTQGGFRLVLYLNIPCKTSDTPPRKKSVEMSCCADQVGRLYDLQVGGGYKAGRIL
jgi:hypothetical protein